MADVGGREAPALVAYGLRPLADNAISIDDPAGFELIYRNDINLVIWDRLNAPDLTSLMPAIPDARDVDPDAGPHLLRACSLGRDCADYLSGLLGLGSHILALGEDMTRLAALFMAVGSASAVSVRLERLEHNGCRLFHADNVQLRLLCSYVGPGTQWLDENVVDRRALGSKSNARICRNRKRIRTLPRGAIGLFKGERWPHNAGRGIVHRSPPIAAKGQSRVLLCMDLVD